MAPRRVGSLHLALAVVAPGRPLREGLDRIVKAKMGALVVVGDGPEVLSICSGGFLLDAAYSPQRLSELAKMDGAIILAADASRIARANVHLVPNPNVPTSETGTRHRTAERVARSIDVPVISVSEDMGVIAVYVGGMKHILEEIPRLLNRANQALQTLERYKIRLDDGSAELSQLEVEDVVSVRDVVAVLQRGEMVRRIAEELETYIIELGVDARLIRLQLDEILGDLEDDRWLVIQDYLFDPDIPVDDALEELASIETDDLLDVRGGRPRSSGCRVTWTSSRTSSPGATGCWPRCRGCPRASSTTSSIASAASRRSCGRPSTTSRTCRAWVRSEPRAIKDGLSRLAESSILDRYS